MEYLGWVFLVQESYRKDWRSPAAPWTALSPCPASPPPTDTMYLMYLFLRAPDGSARGSSPPIAQVQRNRHFLPIPTPSPNSNVLRAKGERYPAAIPIALVASLAEHETPHHNRPYPDIRTQGQRQRCRIRVVTARVAIVYHPTSSTRSSAHVPPYAIASPPIAARLATLLFFTPPTSSRGTAYLPAPAQSLCDWASTTQQGPTLRSQLPPTSRISTATAEAHRLCLFGPEWGVWHLSSRLKYSFASTPLHRTSIPGAGDEHAFSEYSRLRRLVHAGRRYMIYTSGKGVGSYADRCLY